LWKVEILKVRTLFSLSSFASSERIGFKWSIQNFSSLERKRDTDYIRSIFLKGLKKSRNFPVRITNLEAKIRSQNTPNMDHCPMTIEATHMNTETHLRKCSVCVSCIAVSLLKCGQV
jgi:hypothetical protein